MKNEWQIFSFYNRKSITVAVFITFVVFGPYRQTFGQLTERFDDGNFTDNPTWSGHDAHFVVSSNMLQLMAPAVSDVSILATPISLGTAIQWECYVRMDFNPSSANYVRIHLVSDQPDLSGSGFYVMIGSSTDDISLYQQAGTVKTKLIDGADGVLNLNMCRLRIRVMYRNNTWTLSRDVGLTGTFTAEGNAKAALQQTGGHFGMACIYSATRSDKFFFDDLLISNLVEPDITPPQCEDILATSDRTLLIRFSEAMDTTRVTPGCFLLNPPASASPETWQWLPSLREIRLSFLRPFPNGETCSLQVQNLADIAGNMMVAAALRFIYFQYTAPVYQDVVINEMMADPSPPQQLPEAEYIEIYNRSTAPFQLRGWTISDGQRTGTLPDYILLPGTFAVLTGQATALAPWQPLGISDFPSLNNDGDRLVLRNEQGVLMDDVAYTNNWYRSSDKQDGGWSLERIDPDNHCDTQTNWTACEHDDGGTPGKQNSVWAQRPDEFPPALLQVIAIDADAIVMAFNEKLSEEPPPVSSISIVPEVVVHDIRFYDESRQRLVVRVSSLMSGVVYTLTAAGVADCAGNSLRTPQSISFVLPEDPNPGDVVINEILFNPSPTGTDFVEVVNVSGKYINMKGWRLAHVSDTGYPDAKTITSNDYLLSPGSFLVFTGDADVLKGEYIQAHEDRFLQAALPSMNDSEGSIAILDAQSNAIDALRYQDAWHSPFLQDTEGVSLERIDLHASTQQSSNWASAASAAGYATPGYLNSAARNSTNINGEDVRIEPDVFSPANPLQSFARITYQLSTPNLVGVIAIYDQQGRRVKQVCDQMLLGTSGFVRWDGDCDDGGRARQGCYLVQVELFNANGFTQVIRKPVVIADFR